MTNHGSSSGNPSYITIGERAGDDIIFGANTEILSTRANDPNLAILNERSFVVCYYDDVVTATRHADYNVVTLPPPINLPVELVDFRADRAEDFVDLFWITASEENNMGFEIERSSDGINWTTIDMVEGYGTTTALQSYAYTDTRPLSGQNYYRLKQMDFDGKFDYSEIRSVLMDVNEAKFIEVFPNPSAGDFTISLNNPKMRKARVRLFDSIGNLIWEQDFRNDEINVYWEKQFSLPQRELYL